MAALHFITNFYIQVGKQFLVLSNWVQIMPRSPLAGFLCSSSLTLWSQALLVGVPHVIFQQIGAKFVTQKYTIAVTFIFSSIAFANFYRFLIFFRNIRSQNFFFLYQNH